MTTEHPLFPVRMNATWCAPEEQMLDAGIQQWLLDPGSLTARLKQHSQTFRVELLGQQVQTCEAIEANEDIAIGEQVLVREVLLYCDDIPQVFARSLLPLTSLTGEQQALAHLGTKSLGQVLFNHPQLQRKKIEIAAFDITSSVATLATVLALAPNYPMWGRRSTFVLDNKPLIVAEVFLPGSVAYLAQEISNV